ncbi:M16 family metallopeptidase [Pajaroellobacter abortibovis]|uniref:Peptidase M16 n=1 Tax=Pajaroellobacter abortibovis TaxID=1882918 RepID=A0A1L6MV89_9BACT|nr:pitrilysin family protein [Pajaroellobacter abortibovis]APR99422.1 hypothetical protein BCY86_01040 [Pajaroellobacter abortibovis]
MAQFTDLGLNIQQTTLDNGLRVVTVAQPHLHTAHLTLFVRAGSRFETRESHGLSHFLEHMVYRGTKRLPSAHAIGLSFERLGSFLYASTQADSTTFSASVPPESLEQVSLLCGEVIGSPQFYDIDIEKKVVCEEILEDLDEYGRPINPDNLSRALIYPHHPLGLTIPGDAQTVSSFEESMLHAHHTLHYTGASCVLVLSGALDPQRSLEWAERAFAYFPRGSVLSTPPPVHRQKKARLKIVRHPSSQTALRLCFRAIAETDSRYPALELLLRIIDDGMSTRLYHQICNQKGLCYDVSSGYDGYEDDGIIDFAAYAHHTQVPLVAQGILSLLHELATQGPYQEELDQAYQRCCWDLRSMLDSPEDIASSYGYGLLANRFQTSEQKLAVLRQVTCPDVQEMARMLIQPSRLNVVAVGLLPREARQRLSDIVHGWEGA